MDFQGPQIRLDLGEMVRTGQYRKILNFIDHLPQASHYYQAVANDDEHVELILKAQEAQGGQPEAEQTGPPLSEWTATVDSLAQVRDLLSQILTVSIAAAGGKPEKARSAPRPATKFDTVRARKLKAKQDRILSMVKIAEK